MSIKTVKSANMPDITDYIKYSYAQLAGLTEQQIQALDRIKNNITEETYNKFVDMIAYENGRKASEEYKILMEKQNTSMHRFINFWSRLLHAPYRLICSIHHMIEQRC